MQVPENLRSLFAAYSKLNAHAFKETSLLSCNVLSKAPHCGHIADHFLARATHNKLTVRQIFSAACLYTAANIGHFAFLLFCKIAIICHKWQCPSVLKKTPTSDNPLLIIDTFALFDSIATENAYKEKYLPQLNAVATKNGWQTTTLYRHYGSRNPFTAWKTIRILAQLDNGFMDVHLFRWADWFQMLKHCLTYPRALYRFIKGLRQYPDKSPEAYIRETLCHTCGQCVLTGEARRLAGIRLGAMPALAPTPTPSCAIITWYENQTVNKTFHHGLRQAQVKHAQKTPILGAQLFTWPAALLNNHADDTEIALNLCPDCVAVNGDYFLPEHSLQKYITGPSLRYQNLFVLSGERLTPNSVTLDESSKDIRILALLSYHPDETRQILRVAKASQKTTSYEWAFKFHPATQPSAYQDLLPEKACIITHPLSAALNNIDLVVGSGTGALAEAICLGVPAITILPDSIQLPLNYLPPFGENTLWASVRSYEEMAQAIPQLLQFRTQPNYLETVRQFRELLFTEPNAESIKRLLEHALHPAQ